MLALCVSIFLASLAGSGHCAGMCGAFLLVVTTASGRAHKPAILLHAAYNLGRLLTYITLGIAAGSLGTLVQDAGMLVGVQRAAVVVAGGIMIAGASLILARHAGVRTPRIIAPPVMQRTLLGAHRAISPWSPTARAFATGLLTTLLPCGWLYAFVIAAAGTASPLWGGVAMATFWLGTLPIMAVLGLGLHRLAGPLRARLPVLTTILVLGVGVMAVCGRTLMPSPPEQAVTYVHTTKSTAPRTFVPICHGDPVSR